MLKDDEFLFQLFIFSEFKHNFAKRTQRVYCALPVRKPSNKNKKTSITYIIYV